MPLPVPGPRYQALLALLQAAEEVWHASHALFRRWRLSPSQFNVLNLLGDQAAGMTQTELGRQLLMHRSNVTGLVNRLARRGLLRRHPSIADRRAWKVRLTRRGQALLAGILPDYYAAAESVWGALPVRRARALQEDAAALAGQARALAVRFSRAAS